MINKFEAIGILLCVGIMALALFFMRLDSAPAFLSSINADTQAASVVVSKNDNADTLASSLANSMTASGQLENLIVDDVVLGEGATVKEGDTVRVHYIGTLQNGQQFDNSYVKGSPYTFTVGEGKVIKGWDQGLLGMQKGGQRILVIPANLAYGNRAVGPIPANSPLVFAIELVEIQ